MRLLHMQTGQHGRRRAAEGIVVDQQAQTADEISVGIVDDQVVRFVVGEYCDLADGSTARQVRATGLPPSIAWPSASLRR